MSSRAPLEIPMRLNREHSTSSPMHPQSMNDHYLTHILRERIHAVIDAHL